MSKTLPNVISEQSRVALIVTAGVGIISATAGIVYLYRKWQESRPPKKWRLVGELADLICYPIKSCGAVHLKQAECTELSLKVDYLRDRIFMVVTTQGEFVTGRKYPKLVLIQPEVKGKTMTLSAQGMMDIDVDIERLHTIPSMKSIVWGETVDAVDCGEEVARWFSRYILSEDFGLRLMYYYKEKTTRDSRGKNKKINQMKASDSGALHDATSFMLFNESSLADLNIRTGTPIPATQFRPNFVVRGPAAYDEDNWKWVKIGENVIFKSVKPCTRCVFTTVSPTTGEKDPDVMPLKALREYRNIVKGEPPILGIHLGVRIPGQISVGDLVYVEDNNNC